MPNREQCKRHFGATLPAFCSMDKGQKADVMGLASSNLPNVCAGVCVRVWARVRGRTQRKARALAWGFISTIHTLHIQREAFINGAKAGKGCSFFGFPLFTQGGCP